MTNSSGLTMDAEMHRLRLRYCDRLAENLMLIDVAVASCQAGALDAEGREQLRVVAHKLAGTGATYGFAEISTHGLNLDDLLTADPLAAEMQIACMAERLGEACRAAICQGAA